MTQAEAAESPDPAVRILILLACAAGVGGALFLNVNAELPSVFPVFWLGITTTDPDSLAPLAAIPVLFLLWSLPQFFGNPRLPFRSVLLAFLLVILIALWFIGGWSYGVEYQGAAFVWTMLGVNGILAVTAFVAARRLRRDRSWKGVVAWHTGFFAWMTCCAFPWLGESI